MSCYDTMASADRIDLLPLLLRQIDRYPQGVLDGVDLNNAEPALVNHLLANGILIEEAPLQAIPPDAECQDELPRLVLRQGSRAVAFSAEASSAPEAVDPCELVQYSIDVQRLCSAIRGDNNLTGSGPEILSPQTILIGWTGNAASRIPVVLCRYVGDQNVNEIVHMLISRLSSDRPILITPTERPLGIDSLNSLRERGLGFVAAADALRGGSGRPFAFRLEEWLSPVTAAANADVALDIDIAGHRALFFEQELKLAPREFTVLVELAKAYPSGQYVSRGTLYKIMYPHEDGRESGVYEEQITDAGEPPSRKI